MKKLFLLSFSVLFLFGACGKPIVPNKETVKWSTYEKKSWGLSFQYPSDLKVGQDMFDSPIHFSNSTFTESFYMISTTDICDAASDAGMETVEINGNKFWKFSKEFNQKYGYAIFHPNTQVCLSFSTTEPQPGKEYSPAIIEQFEEIMKTVKFDEPYQSFSWKTYKNEKMGFSLNVPDKVLDRFGLESSFVPLNVWENKESVYFSTRSLEDALNKHLYDLKVSGTTITNENQIVSFLESVYEVKGCGKLETTGGENGIVYVGVFAKDSSLQPDDPLACFIGGKVRTQYDTVSGKLVTYQVTERFFSVPDGFLDEDSLASLQFVP